MRKNPTQAHLDQAVALVAGEDLTGYELAKRAGTRPQHVYNVFPKARRQADGTIKAEAATKWLAGFLANR
jgi:hypothetical protein